MDVRADVCLWPVGDNLPDSHLSQLTGSERRSARHSAMAVQHIDSLSLQNAHRLFRPRSWYGNANMDAVFRLLVGRGRYGVSGEGEAAVEVTQNALRLEGVFNGVLPVVSCTRDT